MRIGTHVRRSLLVLALGIATVATFTLLPSRLSLVGNLLSGWTDEQFRTFLDTNSDTQISTQEFRRGLVTIVRRVIARDGSYDLDGNGTVNNADIRSGVSFIRSAILVVCGNGVQEVWEDCDNGATQGCDTMCRKAEGDLIIDDGDPGYTQSGSWLTGNGYRQDSSYATIYGTWVCGSFSASCQQQTTVGAAWAFHNLPSGHYSIYAPRRPPIPPVLPSTTGPYYPATRYEFYDGNTWMGSETNPSTRQDRVPYYMTDSDGISWEKMTNIAITSGDILVTTNNLHGGLSNEKIVQYALHDAVMIRRSECGDGRLQEQEQCDDGNTAYFDGCNPGCEIEKGYVCTSASPSICTFVCGNGVLDPRETCDDGNVQAEDGCNNVCEIEDGFRCKDMPSSCHAIVPNVTTAITSMGVQDGSMVRGSDGQLIMALNETYPLYNGYRLGVLKCGDPLCADWEQRHYVWIDTAAAVTKKPAITVGSDDLPLLAFVNDTKNEVTIAHCETLDCSNYTKWPPADSPGSPPETSIDYLSIIEGPDGLGLIGFFTNTDGGKYVVMHCADITCSSVDWQNDVRIPPGMGAQAAYRSGSFWRMVRDGDGNPLIVVPGRYPNSDRFPTFVLHCADGTCADPTISLIPEDVAQTFVNGVSLANDGKPLLYIDGHGSAGAFSSIIFCGDHACTPAGITRTYVPAQNDNAITDKTAFVTGSDGVPLVIHWPNGYLRAMHCGTPNCSESAAQDVALATVPTAGILEVVIGSDGRPAILYYDTNGNDTLQLLHCGENECH